MIRVIGDNRIDLGICADTFKVDGVVVERVTVGIIWVVRICDLKRIYAVSCWKTKYTSIVVYELCIDITVAVLIQSEDCDVRCRTATRLERLTLSLAEDSECEVARINVSVAEAVDVGRLCAAETLLF